MKRCPTFLEGTTYLRIIKPDVKVISHYGRISKAVGGTQYFKNLPGDGPRGAGA
jgi:hypothetical protein